ncbi:sugar ABC transporter ATP-binding protein [Christensenella tenuis]|uniref:Sugar ABC transporter ATP-binding protein n=1 Tax=Christensenella tenuis TaxID=2763033 RepID=A0ABR7EIU7_9FIRM|nr:sugar ABC transporter ATP-binding protein [Christensenella tenuis]MBC5649311.1 sugar ABC transporter ATP-binding protein [Christensenella tenuis]
MDTEVIYSIKNISKIFPGVRALNHISFDIKRGDFHAIVGENGAGKSTLMNVLAGIYTPEEGELFFGGKQIKLKSPRHAQDMGIAMIHQELSLSNALSIAENIYENRLPKNKLGLVDLKKLYQDTTSAMKYVDLDYLDPRTLIREISTAQQQLVEIAKALALNAKLIIMDEPTSALTQSEVETLFRIISDLKSKGITIIYISHKLDEVMRLSDTITVMRDGEHIETTAAANMTMQRMISLMVGREYNMETIRDSFVESYTNRKVVLEVEDLCVGRKVQHASWKLYEGETLGITGLVGAGRSEMLQAVFGVDKRDSGTIRVMGQEKKMASAREAIECGMGLVPQGRKAQGLFLNLSVKDNMTSVYLKKMRGKSGLLNLKGEDGITCEYAEKLRVKTPTIDQLIKNLSGGNQQKVIIARWLMNHPKVLFLDEPTQGIDIGAKEEIYAIINDLVKQGISVVLVSSEMQETLTLCDRVIVMHEGKIMGELMHNELSEEKIMYYATGCES